MPRRGAHGLIPMLASLIIATLCSFAAALVLTPPCRALASRLGWMDVPDRARKLHSTPTPRAGGIPVFASYMAAMAVLVATPLRDTEAVRQALPFIRTVTLASLIVLATGLLDDARGLSPWRKLLGQTAAAAAAIAGGVHVNSFAGQYVGTWWTVPLTLFWLLACTNAFNLIDGMDGLACGVGLSATLTIFFAAILHGDFGLALATAPLAGALLGFLRFNLSPASIFLGDAGSLWIGFLLGCYGVVWSHKSSTVLGMTAPLMALAIPLCDTALAITRRYLCHRPIFAADRSHIHHRLLELGLSPRRVTLLLCGASGLAAAFAIVQTLIHNRFRGLVLLVFCFLTWVGIQTLGYPEFRVAARLMRFRELIGEQVRLQGVADSVAAAHTPEDCFTVIRQAAREFGFGSVSLRLAGQSFVESISGGDGRQWTLTIPLSDGDYVCLTHAFGDSAISIVAPLADVLQRTLSGKRLRKGPQSEMDASEAHGVAADA